MNNFLTTVPIAHRGLHSDGIPENSMAAYHAAAAKGYAIELDIRLTKDNQLVVFHDDDLRRIAKIDKKVIDCTLAQLEKVHIYGTRETIPSFERFLREINGLTPVLIEIKDIPRANKKDYIGRVVDALKDYKGDFAVQSFQPFLVKRFKKARPDIACGILATAQYGKLNFNNSFIWKLKGKLMKNMTLNALVKPDFISYNLPDYPQKVTDKFTGIKLAWVAHSEEEELHARTYADNIIFEDYLPQRGIVSPR